MRSSKSCDYSSPRRRCFRSDLRLGGVLCSLEYIACGIRWLGLCVVKGLVLQLVARHLLVGCRERDTRRHIAKCFNDAARGGDVAIAVVALQVILSLERVPCLPQ